jgi:hypothetical protein
MSQLAQDLFNEVKARKEAEFLAQLDTLASPLVAQMLEAGLLVVDTDDQGRQILRGTTAFATEQAIEAACIAAGTTYVPTWHREDSLQPEEQSP